MKGEPAERRPYLWAARLLMALIILSICLLVRKAWRKKSPVAPSFPRGD